MLSRIGNASTEPFETRKAATITLPLNCVTW